jgi:ketosteroid isomerase-like protein
METDSELKTQIYEVIERFSNLVSKKDMGVLDEFAASDEVLLVGSDSGEIAHGRQELEAFFKRVYNHDASFSWTWNHINVWHTGDIAWFFADGQVLLTGPNGQRKSPYRTSGVLERDGTRWYWRQYHGSEPVISK